MKKVDTFANRLREAMEIRHMRASELSKLSGIGRANISSYLSGRYEANSVRTYQLAKVLFVDPLWLMGADTSMEKNHNDLREATHAKIDSLSEEQLKKVLKFIEEFL